MGYPSLMVDCQSKVRQLSVLVLDDDLITLELMQMFLESLQYKVFVASCISEAKEIANREVLDILISDIQLPDGTGAEIMSQLLSRSVVYGIAITGFSYDESLEKVGFAKQLTKPIDFGILESVLTNADVALKVA